MTMSSILSDSLTPEMRSKRSILVGNISSEATEEELRLLLLEFGPIVSFRFFNDGPGSQIGYAFCEYEMQDMAVRALFKLNDIIFKGQALKVDTAASEKSREELENFLQGAGNAEIKQEPATDMDVTTEKAPEEISKAVASLPPEQMFELMKQMKMCIENNPHEARNLLLQNPQLAYALLQAQVIMRIVDPEVAMKISERPIGAPPEISNVIASDGEPTLNSVLNGSTAVNNITSFTTGIPVSMAQNANLSGIMPPMGVVSNQMNGKDFPTSNDQDMRQLFGESSMGHMNGSEVDPRFRVGMDPRMMQGLNVRAQDPRMIPGPNPRGFQGADPRALQGPDPRMMQGPPDPRIMQGPDIRPVQGPNPRTAQGLDRRVVQGADSQSMMNSDPRSIPVSDPRSMRSQDPRAPQLPDPRIMAVPGSDPRMSAVDPRMIPGSKLSGTEVRLGPGDPRSAPVADPRMLPSVGPRIGSSVDPRIASSGDPRMAQSADPRIALSIDPRMVSSGDPRMTSAVDPRVLPVGDPRALSSTDPRARSITDPRVKQVPDSRILQGPEIVNLPPVSRDDPRKPATSEGVPASTSLLPVGSRTPTITTTSAPGITGASDSLPNMSSVSAPQDQEKAALIMQVLQLSDEQIAMLPPEQRQSILILKEQIARSHLAA